MVQFPLGVVKDCIKTIIPDSFLIHRLPRKIPNSVLLTFDDGPDEKLTPQVLERLAKYDVRAVFFVIGSKAEKLPHILEMVVSEGHVIGNHTFSHSYEKLPSLREYRKDILKCRYVVEQTVGVTPLLYRPPAGKVFVSGLLLVKWLQMKTMLWSIEGGEWGVHKKDSARTLGSRIVRNIKTRDIVLLHDNNVKTLEVLDMILPEIAQRNIDLDGCVPGAAI